MRMTVPRFLVCTALIKFSVASGPMNSVVFLAVSVLLGRMT